MQLRRLSDLFWNVSPNLFFVSTLLAFLTGICYALLIPFILYATGSDMSTFSDLEVVSHNFFNSPTSDMAKVFLLTCVGIILVKSSAIILSLYIATKAAVEHRLHLYKRIRSVPYIKLEQFGQSKIINLLNVDVSRLTTAAVNLPVIWVSLVTVIGTLGYLLYLNVNVFLFVLGCLVVGIVTYQLPILIGMKYITRSRDDYDKVQEGVKGLIYGAKELKLNFEKYQSYYNEELHQPERDVLKNTTVGMSTVIFAESYGEIISFLVIGIVVFHLPYVFQISQLELFGIVAALLYLTGPIGAILNAMGTIKTGQVSLKKLQDFYDDLVDEFDENDSKFSTDWKEITLKDVGFKYPGTVDGFALKNINVSFRRGQVSYIVGGNGSGKSTLSKILSHHYEATFGDIYFGETPISALSLKDVRSQISAIYTDFYVFPKLYGDWEEKKLTEYLEYLELSDKVKVENRRFSTTDLSDGQRKRLAMLSLLLENRPVCIFDEWAADQDPRFRDVFYYTILPELKRQGKVVIVISHDDRYFSCADQLITMEVGTIREIQVNPELSEVNLLERTS